MTLNKTKIEWCDRTWNPVTGCKHGCSYCYARKIAERFKGSKAWPQGFEPMYHRERLIDPANNGNPQTIFVCSMADLFGEWVPEEWTRRIFTVSASTRHSFIFLTKNPSNMMRLFLEWYGCVPNENESFMVLPYHWFGTTVTGKDDAYKIKQLQQFPHPNRFVSFEPLLSDPGDIDLTGIRQIIIGEQTNPRVGIDFFLIESLMETAGKCGTKVFVKHPLPFIWKNCRELCWSVNK